MPFTLNVNHEHTEVDAVAIGPITYSDTVNHLLNERHFSGLAYKEFIDARNAGFMWTPEEIRAIAATIRNLCEELNFGPTAILVATDAAFGTVRVLEQLIGEFAEVKPFRDEQEARAWLATRSSV